VTTNEPQSYLTQFLRLRCAPDVLASVGPMHKAEKEISESWALLRRIRSIALAEPMRWTLLDACAGNCLTSVLAVHCLPIRNAIAIEIKPNHIKRPPERWAYLQTDIHDYPTHTLTGEDARFILVASHPCKSLARAVVDLYKSTSLIRHLVMLPCCQGQPDQSTPGINFVRRQMGRYSAWCYSLAHECGGDLYMDQRCLSPCRGVVWASKEKS